MNMHMQVPSLELLKQFREAQERRARMSGAPKILRPEADKKKKPSNPKIVIGKVADAHVVTYLFYQNQLDASASRVMVSTIVDVVCAAYDVSKVDIVSQRRSLKVVRPRQIVMYLAKTMTKSSYPEIGKRLGGRDHTTIMHGVNRINSLRKSSPNLDAELQELTRILGGDE
jgi:hypothetical protein